MRYVYEVVSDRPLEIWNGSGNALTIGAGQYNALVKRDEVRSLTDNHGVTASLELKERIEVTP